MLSDCARPTKRVSAQARQEADDVYVAYRRHLRRLTCRAIVQEHNIDISPDVLWQAGLAVAAQGLPDHGRARATQAVFIAGGAQRLAALHRNGRRQGLLHDQLGRHRRPPLLAQDPPVVYRLFNPVPQKVVDELMEKLPDFKRGYLEDGLEVEEFERVWPGAPFQEHVHQKLEACVRDHPGAQTGPVVQAGY